MYGSVSYIVSVVRGRAKPNRVSWLFWGVPSTLAAAVSIIEDGFSLPQVFVLLCGVMPLTIFVFALFCRRAYWKLNKPDYVCGVFAAAAFVSYLIFRDPILSISLAIATDMFASIPTVIKVWKHPESESITIWITSTAASWLNLLLITNWGWTDCAYTIYLIVANTGALVCFLIGKRLARGRTAAVQTK